MHIEFSQVSDFFSVTYFLNHLENLKHKKSTQIQLHKYKLLKKTYKHKFLYSRCI